MKLKTTAIKQIFRLLLCLLALEGLAAVEVRLRNEGGQNRLYLANAKKQEKALPPGFQSNKCILVKFFYYKSQSGAERPIYFPDGMLATPPTVTSFSFQCDLCENDLEACFKEFHDESNPSDPPFVLLACFQHTLLDVGKMSKLSEHHFTLSRLFSGCNSSRRSFILPIVSDEQNPAVYLPGKPASAAKDSPLKTLPLLLKEDSKIGLRFGGQVLDTELSAMMAYCKPACGQLQEFPNIPASWVEDIGLKTVGKESASVVTFTNSLKDSGCGLIVSNRVIPRTSTTTDYSFSDWPKPSSTPEPKTQTNSLKTGGNGQGNILV